MRGSDITRESHCRSISPSPSNPLRGLPSFLRKQYGTKKYSNTTTPCARYYPHHARYQPRTMLAQGMELVHRGTPS